MKVKERSEIDNKYKWKLEDIYENEDLWNRDFEKLQSLMGGIANFKGKLNNKDSILKCFKYQDEIEYLFTHLFLYAHMRVDQDVREAKYQEMYGKCHMLAVQFSQLASFIEPELTKNPKDFLVELSKDSDLLDYSYRLELTIKNKKHTLSEKEEAILANASRMTGIFQEAFSMIDNSDIKFEPIVNDKGETVEVSHGLYGYYLETGSREEREKVFNSMFNAFKQNIHVIATLYKGNIQKDIFYSQVSKYKSCLDMYTCGEDVPVIVYNKLIKNIHKNLPTLHKYMKIRKKILKYKELHMWDLHMPLYESVTKEIPYEEAQGIVLTALKPLGEEYQELLKTAFSQGWIDVYENTGKRGGAYSSGGFGTHPYVLLNYQPTLDSVSTIAHELGHSMHTYYSCKNQPQAKADYKIFVAEVASTVNEMLLIRHLLKDAEGTYKKYLLTNLLDMFRTTVFRQSQFAEFEAKAHELGEKNIPITPEALNDLYYNLNKEYYGPAVTHDELIKYEWARIPHFYSSFYVYKYATGLLSAVCISQDIINEGEKAVARYKKFLSAGGSMSPVEILKLVGVDLTTDEPYQKAFKFYKDTLDEFIKLN